MRQNQARFLELLTEATKETGVTISSCGCCASPYLGEVYQDARGRYTAGDEGERVNWLSPRTGKLENLLMDWKETLKRFAGPFTDEDGVCVSSNGVDLILPYEGTEALLRCPSLQRVTEEERAKITGLVQNAGYTLKLVAVKQGETNAEENIRDRFS